MLKPFIVAAVVAVSATISKAEEPPKQYVEAITIEEFTKLSLIPKSCTLQE